MTKLSFKEVRDKFDGFINSFFEEIADGSRLILGVSDTTSPGAEFDRILKITELAKQFGPIPESMPIT